MFLELLLNHYIFFLNLKHPDGITSAINTEAIELQVVPIIETNNEQTKLTAKNSSLKNEPSIELADGLLNSTEGMENVVPGKYLAMYCNG